MTPVKMAIVGVGRMGTFHARHVARLDTVEVVAVADTDPGRASTVAAEIGANGCSSIESLMARDDIEAWLVASSTPSHPELVSLAIEHGIHVLCEKPLALDEADGARLGRLAQDSGLVLQVGFWRRFSPPWAAAKRLLDDGVIGRPLMLRLSQWDADPPPSSFCDPTVSGGLAVDCGIHEFDLVEWLTGLKVTSVSGRNLPLVDASLAEVGDVDNLVAVLEIADGAVATVDLSRNCRYGDDVRTEILGEDGAMFVDLLPTGRTRLATAAGVEIVEDSQSDDAMGEGVRTQATAFARAVRGEPIEIPTADAGTRALRIGRAVQQSAASGSPVEVTGAATDQS